MVVKKFNYYRLFVFLVILFAIIFGCYKLISNYNYKKSDEFKLISSGYKDDEIKIIKDKINDNDIDSFLKIKYNEYTIKFIQEKYFIYDNLVKYLDYKKENKLESYTNIVSIINTEANIDWLEEVRETDTSKGDLMLVNRLYGLSSDYEPSDIVSVSPEYAYSNVKISESILDDIINMMEDAEREGYKFVLSDGYRSYKEQETIFENYKKNYGYSEADRNVARPGHSEYQTGISFDIVPYNKVFDEPKSSEEYIWLKNNAYKYGFIFRFPENKINLTQFNAYTWRLRYVGVDAATLIDAEDICFEEYYAYFVN